MRNFVLLGFVILAALLAACNKTPKPAALYLESEIPHAQLGDNIIPSHYNISLRLDPKSPDFTGLVEIDISVAQATQNIWLHAKEITVTEAHAVVGEDIIAATFEAVSLEEAPSGVAKLTFDAPLTPGRVRLVMSYRAPYNQALFSSYQVKRGEDAYIITQFEPMGARGAFPSFDEPRFKVPFDLTITSPSENIVYANTTKMAQSEIEPGWTQHIFSTTRPLPTYLLAYGVGPFDVSDFGEIPPNAVRKRPLKLRGLAAKGSGDQLKYALDNTDGILTALETYFGSQYPYGKLDIIAAPEYAFGAMENPGAIVYREYLLLLSDNAPLSQRRAYARVHGHELAHQWFGNLVTPVWWEDIWLNEAFATWMGNKAVDLWKPEGGFERTTLKASLGAMRLDSLASVRKVREPLSRSENVMDQFDGITYRKGGGVLSMFESYLGEEKFRDGVRLHMKRYADDVATGDDFFKSIADGSGNPDVVSAMKSFVDQAGLPLISGESACKDSDEPYKVSVSQSRYAPLGSTIDKFVDPDFNPDQGWEVPICIKYSAGGTIKKQCELLKMTRQVYTLDTPSCSVDWMMLNADGAGYYRFSMPGKEWANLLNNIENLNGRETLAALDSLRAAFEAGGVDADVYLTGLQQFASLPDYEVASSAADAVAALRRIIPSDARPAFAKYINNVFAARYVAIDGKNTPEGQLLGPKLASLLLGSGENAVMRAKFARQGERYLGLSSTADKKSVTPNMLSAALREAMRANPAAATPALRNLAKSGSAFEKGAAIGALGSAQDNQIAAQIRGYALSDEAGLTGRQAASLISVMMSNESQTDDTWAWLKTNFDAFTTARVADVRKPGLPGYARFCNDGDAVDVKRFFESKADLIPGYERNLTQSLEGISLCAALKESQSKTMSQALSDRT